MGSDVKISGDIKAPDMNVELPKFGVKGPDFGGDMISPTVDIQKSVEPPHVDLHAKPDIDVSIPAVDLSLDGEKKKGFSFGFGSKKEKKKKKKKGFFFVFGKKKKKKKKKKS